jgi:ATP-binding protein involved in chromosome partitioning
MRIFSEVEDAPTNPRIADELGRVRENLADVRSILAIGSAKGGVGKSVIGVNLAAALAMAGRKIGILDADLNSPSVLAMLGMKMPARSLLGSEGLEPWSGPLGLRVAGSSLIPDGEPPPISFVEQADSPAVAPNNGREPTELRYAESLRRILGQTRFGALDLLIVDLAPGLERLHQIARLAPLTGVVLVSQPSDLAVRALRAALQLAAKLHSRVVGIIENMAGFSCEGCHSVRPLLPYGEMARLARESNLHVLGRLPFDTRLAETCDNGSLFVRSYPDAPLAKQLVEIAHALEKLLIAPAAPASQAN